MRFIKIFSLTLLLGLVLSGNFVHTAPDGTSWDSLVLKPDDRILILAPHPDDEILGCAGVIQKAVSLNLPLRIVFLTYGDSNQWAFMVYRKHPVVMPKAIETMGVVRHDEAVAASAILGVGASHLTFLGYPDFGTIDIWLNHWGTRPAYRSLLTRSRTVPYKDAFRYGAHYKGEEILQDIITVLRRFHPTKIFVSHPADHNGDHLAFYLFTRVALWEAKMDRFEIYPYLIHDLSWPRIKGDHPEEIIEPPSRMENSISWKNYFLPPSAIEKKREALEAHKSQYQSSKKYLLSFIRRNELFGDFPIMKLTKTETLFNLSSGEEKNGGRMTQPPEELTEIERAAFVGIEWRGVQWKDDKLILSTRLSQPLAEGVEASIYIFGYRSDRYFAQMPKLHIKLGGLKYSVYDQTRLIPSDAVTVQRTAKEITIQLPLSLLGNPEKILMSARTYLSEVPLDRASWRILEINSLDETIDTFTAPNPAF